MNLKEKIRKFAVEFGKKHEEATMNQIRLEQGVLAGFEKTIELLSSGGEFSKIKCHRLYHDKYTEVDGVPHLNPREEAEFIQIEALAAANLKISTLEEEKRRDIWKGIDSTIIAYQKLEQQNQSLIKEVDTLKTLLIDIVKEQSGPEFEMNVGAARAFMKGTEK